MLESLFFNISLAMMLPLFVAKCSSLITLCHLEFLDLLNGNESISPSSLYFLVKKKIIDCE
jgi:hypothetical protein